MPEVAAILPDTIGGGKVLRGFSGFARGQLLSVEQIERIPFKNRRSLVQTGALHVWPAAPDSAADAEYHIASVGGGKFDVIKGVKVAERVEAAEVFELTGKVVGSMRKAQEAEKGPAFDA